MKAIFVLAVNHRSLQVLCFRSIRVLFFSSSFFLGGGFFLHVAPVLFLIFLLGCAIIIFYTTQFVIYVFENLLKLH
jgi:hypothetical protein